MDLLPENFISPPCAAMGQVVEFQKSIQSKVLILLESQADF